MGSNRNTVTGALQKRASGSPRAALLCVLVFLLAAALAALPGCGGSTSDDGAAPTPSGGLTEEAEAAESNSSGGSDPTGAAYTQPESVAVPPREASGIDTSGVNEGWVCASATADARLKFQVICGDATYNYDLPNDGTPTLFPINMGNGSYTFRIMLNTEGNSYVEYDSAYADVALSSEFAPYLIPNQICSYTADSACVAKARDLTAGAENEAEVVAIICTYVAENVSYDEDKARELSTTTGYVPDPDSTYQSGTGVCFDYASLSAAMLRSMGIPTKIITGYVGEDELYHAWIMVYVDGTWQTAEFKVSPNTWSRCDVTFASTGATQYSGSGNNYTDRYTY